MKYNQKIYIRESTKCSCKYCEQGFGYFIEQDGFNDKIALGYKPDQKADRKHEHMWYSVGELDLEKSNFFLDGDLFEI